MRYRNNPLETVLLEALAPRNQNKKKVNRPARKKPVRYLSPEYISPSVAVTRVSVDLLETVTTADCVK